MRDFYKRVSRFIKHNSILLFTLFSLFWFALRTGTKPSRASYPCQKAAAAQISIFVPMTLVPALFGLRKSLLDMLKNNLNKILIAFVAISILTLGISSYGNYKDEKLIEKLSKQAIPAMSPAAYKQALASYQIPDSPMLIKPNDAVVSFAYNETVRYGEEVPFDRENNPAYDLVWRAVAQLEFGPYDNPLGNFINESDIVLIKPNIGEPPRASYSHPASVRPLIDMAVKAGAKTIRVGDASIGYPFTEKTL
ncbi:DUF362 domain-containing protein, partial [Candidatus Woesearchaeota archaeon]|nr:DUF362 domain-containing protein [Candidatus Woesearchaeota archaeon]